MKENIEKENVLDMLTLADTYSYEDLKTAAMNFIVKNVKMVVTSPKWKNMPQKLVVEILMNVVSQYVI